MVTGNHNGTDTAALCISNSLFGFFTRWVDHRNQTNKGIAVFIFQCKLWTFFCVFVFLHCKCKDTQTIFGKMGVGFRDLCFIFFCDWARTICCHDADAAGKQNVHRTFGAKGVNTIQFVHGTHQLTIRVKCNLCKTRMLCAVGCFFYPEVMSQIDQCNLSWVTDLLTIYRSGVICKNCCL